MGYAAEPMTYGAPMGYAAAPTTYGAPMAYGGYGQPATLFDQLDTNHDGSITRAEFAHMIG
jgi:hypothetical protein